MNTSLIDEAIALLSGDVDLVILQIANSVGFNSKTAFNAAFQKFASSMPQEYQRLTGRLKLRRRLVIYIPVTGGYHRDKPFYEPGYLPQPTESFSSLPA